MSVEGSRCEAAFFYPRKDTKKNLHTLVSARNHLSFSITPSH